MQLFRIFIEMTLEIFTDKTEFNRVNYQNDGGPVA